MNVLALRFVALFSFALAMSFGLFAGEKTPAPPTAAKVDDVPLDIVDWPQAEKIIAEQKGKIVVLDFWSTSCETCVREFPGLTAIHKKFGGDVACMSMNCNYIGIDKPEDERPAVLAFLKTQQASYRNLLSSEEDTVLYKKLNIASIPVVRVYGRDGKLLKQFDNEKNDYGGEGFTYEKHVTPYIAELVKQGK